jgi:hypothetical protein
VSIWACVVPLVIAMVVRLLIPRALELYHTGLVRTIQRKATLTRYVAWGLTLTWAVGAPLLVGFLSQTQEYRYRYGGVNICWGPFVLPVWVTVLIVAGSEEAGGALLTAGSLLWFYVLVLWKYPPRSAEERLVASTLLLPLVAGTLFLASWWRNWKESQAAEREERVRVGAQSYEAAKRYHQTRESLTDSNLSSADLTRVELSKADLRRANLTEGNLEGARLVKATLVAANLRNANLSLANLERSDLSNANLYGANLQGACLKRATLDQADMQFANLRDSNLRGAILWRANLHQADLRGADLQGANLMEAKLAGATLDGSTVMPEGWEDVVASKPQD